MGAGGQSGRWELARTARAASDARAHADAYRTVLGEEPWRRARVVVSELATNAVRHGEGRIELRIDPTPTGLRFCVTDEGSGRPALRTPGIGGGYGLHLVADLADRWGELGPGTAVWFEVDGEAAA